MDMHYYFGNTFHQNHSHMMSGTKQ